MITDDALNDVLLQASRDYLAAVKIEHGEYDKDMLTGRCYATTLYFIYEKYGFDAMLNYMDQSYKETRYSLSRDKLRDFILKDDRCPMRDEDKVYLALC